MISIGIFIFFGVHLILLRIITQPLCLLAKDLYKQFCYTSLPSHSTVSHPSWDMFQTFLILSYIFCLANATSQQSREYYCKFTVYKRLF